MNVHIIIIKIQMGNNNHQCEKSSRKLSLDLNHNLSLKINSQSNEQELENILSVPDNSICKLWQSQIKQLTNDKGFQFLFLPQNYVYRRSLCGPTGVVKSTYKKYTHNLQQEISQRTQHFSITQMWYILYSLVSAGKCLLSHDKIQQKITQKHILLNQLGQIQIITSLSFLQSYSSKLQTVAEIISTQEHLCHQLGMIILNSAIMSTQPEAIQHKIAKLKRIYEDEELISIIVLLCEIDMEKHLCCRKVKKMLAKVEKQILNLEPFQKSKIAIPEGKRIKTQSSYHENIIEVLTFVDSLYVTRKSSLNRLGVGKN